MTGHAVSNIKHRHIKYLGISLGLFAYYAGELSIVLWLASALILVVLVRRLPNWLLAYTVLLTFFFSLRIFLEASAPEDILRDARFYWGFVIFLPFFISEQRRLGNHYSEYAALFRFLINLCLILLLIEFLTANLLALEWPNRSHELGVDTESGSLARAYGFGGNATVTSTLLIALGALLYAGKFMRDIATLGLATSGTGLFVFLLKSALMLKTRHLLMAAALFTGFYITVWVDLLESELRDSYSALGKFSLDYISVLFDIKYEQYQSIMARINGFQLIFGQAFTDPSLRTGDTQLLDFLTFNGLFGVAMLVLIVAKCMNKANRVPLFLVLAGTMHYQVIFSLPGQILFAWVLTVGMRSPRRRNQSTESVAVNAMTEPLAVRG
jgi:hypothetical protein